MPTRLAYIVCTPFLKSRFMGPHLRRCRQGAKAPTFVYTTMPQVSNCCSFMLLVAVESPPDAFTPKNSLANTGCCWSTLDIVGQPSRTSGHPMPALHPTSHGTSLLPSYSQPLDLSQYTSPLVTFRLRRMTEVTGLRIPCEF